MNSKHHPAEPFRIKSIESIKLLSEQERALKLNKAHNNIFKLDAEDIYIDLLTDSGTTALSNKQWAAIMLGDESYAGAKSFKWFEKAVKDIFKHKYVIPTHQGRSAENIMFSTIVKPGQYVFNNTHFDTTKGNTLHKGGIPLDFPCIQSKDNSDFPFKGNMDVLALEEAILKHGVDKIAMVMMTITNNSVGGLPVSIENIREVSALCKQHNLLFYFDCARFAENAFFIKRNEPEFADSSIEEITAEMFELVDGALMSAKKDGMSNIGGFITLNDKKLHEKLIELMIIVEGFPTYGGLTGRDMECLAVGFYEVMDETYLEYRIGQVKYLGEKLKDVGIPIVEPTGGHAVFIDAGVFLSHIPAEEFPGQALTAAFYLEGGIRTVEIGSVMFGEKDSKTGKAILAPREMVRLAIPRRVYTASHIDYIVETAKKIVEKKDTLCGYKITKQPKFLRHFTCDLEKLTSQKIKS
ncbi:MAG TPA: tryptophanase [candidate division Zixibacteria bacterium]|nr:tryptophanase [candidate division Zixibacteria bacterium]